MRNTALITALRLFRPEALYEGGDNFNLALMKPSDFLRLAPPVSRRIAEEGRLESVEARLQEGKALDHIPALELSIDGNAGVVTGHDGRHRAMVLHAMNVALMPVAIEPDQSLGSERRYSIREITALQEVFPQPHDDDDDYPGWSSAELEEKSYPVTTRALFEKVFTPQQVAEALGINAAPAPGL